MAIQLLLDHTGCKSIMMFGGSERQVAYLESLGFILVENNWSAPTALYKDVVLINGFRMSRDYRASLSAKRPTRTRCHSVVFDYGRRGIRPPETLRARTGETG